MQIFKSLLPLRAILSPAAYDSFLINHQATFPAAYHVLRELSTSSPADQATIPLTKALKQLEQKLLTFKQHSTSFKNNLDTMTALNAFIASLRSPTSYPAATVKNFSFTLPNDNGQIQQVRCQIKTTGGDCSKLVQQRLADLLFQCGVNSNFYFDRDEFRPKLPPLRPRIVHKPKSPGSKASSESSVQPPYEQVFAEARTKALAAGVPSQTITEDEFNKLERQQTENKEAKEAASAQVDALAADLEKLNPLLQAVALVPWMMHAKEDPKSLEKAEIVKTKVLDELESWGWDVRGPVRKIWAGERDEKVLVKGKEGGTVAAIQTLLMHAKAGDEAMGKKTYTP